MDTMKTALKVGRATVVRMCLIAQFWILAGTINWLLARFYANNCTPSGFYGWMLSFLTTESSICRMAFNAQQVAMNSYSVVVLLSLHQFALLMFQLRGFSSEIAEGKVEGRVVEPVD